MTMLKTYRAFYGPYGEPYEVEANSLYEARNKAAVHFGVHPLSIKIYRLGLHPSPYSH